MRHTHPHELRELDTEEQAELEGLSRSSAAPAAWVARAKAIRWVQQGGSYAEAGRRIGRTNGDGVSALVKRFNAEGLEAIIPRHGGGKQKYSAVERQRIVAAVERRPTAAGDGTNSWSLMTLRDAIRRAPDGLPEVSTETISRVLHDAGYTWQADRSWCQTGEVQRQRKAGPVVVTDPDATAKKKESSVRTPVRRNGGSRCGVRMKPGHTKPCRTLGIVGNWNNSLPLTRTSIYAREQPNY